MILKHFPPFLAAVAGELLVEFLSLLLLRSIGQPHIQTTWNRELEYIVNLHPLQLKVIHSIRYVHDYAPACIELVLGRLRIILEDHMSSLL